MINPHPAILLLGPTGTGKTPFGQQLETQELWFRKYHHFDFGEQLRASVKPESESLSSREKETVNTLLEGNRLLDDKDFPIAEKLLESFIEEKNLSHEDNNSDIIILNGLPRHTSQAIAIEMLIDVRIVLLFRAPASVIKQRIMENSGGDRTGRTDDSEEEIERKLEIYREYTYPLVDYYKLKDKNILEVDVETDTIPLYIIQSLKSIPSML